MWIGEIGCGVTFYIKQYLLGCWEVWPTCDPIWRCLSISSFFPLWSLVTFNNCPLVLEMAPGSSNIFIRKHVSSLGSTTVAQASYSIMSREESSFDHLECITLQNWLLPIQGWPHPKINTEIYKNKEIKELCPVRQERPRRTETKMYLKYLQTSAPHTGCQQTSSRFYLRILPILSFLTSPVVMINPCH